MSPAMVLALLLFAAPALQDAEAARQAPVSQVQDALPFKPFLDWMLDPGGRLNIQEISSADRQNSFEPLDSRFPPHQSGTLWLRFTLEQRHLLESRPPALLLDMGDNVPGVPLLMVPKITSPGGAVEWQNIVPGRQGLFLLPEAQALPLTMYVRLDGLPSLWFAPMLRTPQNAATALERMVYPAVLTALGVVMLLCLLRVPTDRGQCRVWMGLYVGAALVHAVYGMPAAPEGVVPIRELPGVLAPGIALMLLPHVGRHLMRTREKSRSLDIQYQLLSLPGVVPALLPLVPNLAWTSWYLALWPLVAVLFVPTSLGACIAGLPGARRFLLACLLSMSGATVGILGMLEILSSPLLSAGPLLGVALGALFVAGVASPADSAPKAAPGEAKEENEDDEENTGLRLLSPEEIQGAAPLPVVASPQAQTPAPSLSARDAESHYALDERLRPHLDALLQEGAGIPSGDALPPASRRHVEAMVNAARAITSLLGAAAGTAQERSAAPAVFDLQQLLREAHAQVAEEAERKGLRISWFMPPHLPQYYSGNAAGISQVVRLLLESSVRAAQHGFVQLTVRRVPESVNPGHLLFSISDSGSGMPPHTRSSLALARAWELAGAQGGGMSAESDAQGAAVNFTLQLKPHSMPQAETDAATQTGRVIVVDELSSNRQLLAFFLEGLPCVVEEARNISEAVQTCRTERAALLLMNCDMPESG
ncbi:MAG: response regulator, partial [Deltaproteobacteria bacterium]|nr:response regulator [Deltaproteobacteria bacterium]